MKKKNLIAFKFLFLSFIFYNLKSAHNDYNKNPKGFNVQKNKPAKMRNSNIFAYVNNKRESGNKVEKKLNPNRTPVDQLVKCIGCGAIILDGQNPGKGFKTRQKDLRRKNGFNKKNTWSDNCF
jgi:hypothetical protein